MNNFTAFILGALLAVIVVGYVFFGAEKSSSDKTQLPPAASMVPDAEKAPKPEEQAAPQPSAPETDAPAAPAPDSTPKPADEQNQASPAAPAPTQTEVAPTAPPADTTATQPAVEPEQKAGQVTDNAAATSNGSEPTATPQDQPAQETNS